MKFRLLLSTSTLFLSLNLTSGYQFHASTARTSLLHHHHGISKRDHRPFASTSTRASTSKRSSLSMHMGHSHSHHHHDDHSETVKRPLLLRRKITRVLFAAAVTLLPPLLLRKRITSTNTAIFILTSTTLSFTERMRSEVKFFLSKARNIRDGFMKHAPPEMNASKYLFQNDNAADRVTLVGVMINLLLSVGKAVVGVTCRSSALAADAGHSLSDLFSDFITLWAVQIARLPPDDDVSSFMYTSA